MLSLLDTISETGFAIFFKEATTIWGYPTLLVIHAYGMIILVGLSVAIMLRTLGYASGMPLAGLRKYVPIMWLGLGLNALSGLILFSLDGRLFATMPAMWIKLSAIAVAIACTRRLVAGLNKPATRAAAGKGLPYTGLLAWMIGVGAGRVTAYDAPIQIQTGVAVVVVAVVVVVVVAFGSQRAPSGQAERQGRVTT